ncbi:MAG: hypothetical protein H0T46_24790 [Deltaproteobacteria bacterium]|nr:hypothetical protein [Deltaproteobacteria bacterium]
MTTRKTKNPAAKKPVAKNPPAKKPPAKKPAAKKQAQLTPAQIVDGLVAEYRKSSDPQLVAALAALPALRDEDDLAWEDDAYFAGVAYPYLALVQVSAERRLRPAIKLLLDRAPFGDPRDMMRGLRGSLEAIVEGDTERLADACMAAIATKRDGTILWAAHQLAALDDPRALEVFEKLRHSEHERIREVAELGIAHLVPDNN